MNKDRKTPSYVPPASPQPRRRSRVVTGLVVLIVVYIFFSSGLTYIISSLQDNVVLKASNEALVKAVGDARIVPSKYKVLIAQYSAGQTSHYNVLLNLTEPINRLYAEKWGHDFYVLIGPALESIDSSHKKAVKNMRNTRSTYFKVTLLEHAIEKKHYDILVILDADAIFYDFSRDIAHIIPQERLLVAHKVQRNDSNNTSNVNIGVTVWNLRHTQAQWLSETWKARCVKRIRQGRRDNDQAPLHDILRKQLNSTERNNLVLAVSHEFAYGKGTFVKHFIRLDNSNWSESFERRVGKIQEVWKEVCPRYQLKCRPIAMLNSTSIMNHS